MKNVLAGIIAVAVIAVVAVLGVVYMKNNADDDINNAMNGFYDETGTTFRFNITGWGS